MLGLDGYAENSTAEELNELPARDRSQDAPAIAAVIVAFTKDLLARVLPDTRFMSILFICKTPFKFKGQLFRKFAKWSSRK